MPLDLSSDRRCSTSTRRARLPHSETLAERAFGGLEAPKHEVGKTPLVQRFPRACGQIEPASASLVDPHSHGRCGLRRQ